MRARRAGLPDTRGSGFQMRALQLPPLSRGRDPRDGETGGERALLFECSGMRVFAAIPIEGELRDGLSGLLRNLAGRAPDCRWSRPENLHVTLRFFGEVPDDSLGAIVEFVERGIAGGAPGPISVAGPGFFRNRDRVAIWIGLNDTGWMKEIAGRMSRSIAGAPAETRPFKAHLTLGRMRVRKNPRGEVDKVMKALEKERLPTVAQTESRCVLFQSELMESGARYRELWEAELVGM